MKIEIKTKTKTFGLYVDIDYFKNKIKTIFKNFLGVLGFIALFLLGTMEVKENVSPFATMFIYFGLLAVFTIGIIVNKD